MSTYVQGGPKVMSWAMMVDGQVFIHWFDIGARQNSEVYVQEVLEGFMWPILQTMPNRARYWFQQDGARSHTSNFSLEWLQEKFRPARSPDKSPLDYFLWGICEAEIRRVKPNVI